MFIKVADINDLKNEDLSFLLNTYIKNIGVVADNDGGLRLLHITTDNGTLFLEKNIEQENNSWFEAIIVDISRDSKKDTIIANQIEV